METLECLSLLSSAYLENIRMFPVKSAQFWREECAFLFLAQRANSVSDFEAVRHSGARGLVLCVSRTGLQEDWTVTREELNFQNSHSGVWLY